MAPPGAVPTMTRIMPLWASRLVIGVIAGMRLAASKTAARRFIGTFPCRAVAPVLSSVGVPRGRPLNTDSISVFATEGNRQIVTCVTDGATRRIYVHPRRSVGGRRRSRHDLDLRPHRRLNVLGSGRVSRAVMDVHSGMRGRPAQLKRRVARMSAAIIRVLRLSTVDS